MCSSQLRQHRFTGRDGPTQAMRCATSAPQGDSFRLRRGFGFASASIISPVMSVITRFSTSAYKRGYSTWGVCLERHIESSGGNPDRRSSSQPEALGADQEVTNGLKHSKKRLLRGVSRPCGPQRAVNTEQAPKTKPRKPTRHSHGEGRRRRRRDERRILRFRRGMWWQHAWDRFNVQQGKSAGVPREATPNP